MARSADRVALIAMRGDAAAALELVKDLHEHRADVRIALRCDNNAPEPRRATPMPAKYPGRCSVCATAITVGMPIYYDAGKVTHTRCV